MIYCIKCFFRSIDILMVIIFLSNKDVISSFNLIKAKLVDLLSIVRKFCILFSSNFINIVENCDKEIGL